MTIDSTFWVAVSFFIFFGGLMYLKVPQKINEILNKLIVDIKNEINESEKLRTDAKVLLDNEQKKLDNNNNVSKKLKDAFNLLELDINSTMDEIKKRYKILAKKWHPDVQQNEDSKNKNKFIDITNAYKTILNSFTEK